MKKVSVVIVLIFFFSVNLLAQHGLRESTLSPSLDFFSDNKHGSVQQGRGYTGTAETGGISSILINPASLSPENKLDSYAEYEYKNTNKWLPSISGIDLKQLHPNILAGISYKINDQFTTGIAYSNRNNYRFDYGKIMLTTKTNPDSGEVRDLYTDVSISSVTIPVSYSYKDIFRAGINLNYIFYSSELQPYAETSFGKFVPEFGVIINPISNFSLGMSFRPQVEEKVTVKYTLAGSPDDFTYSEANVFPMQYNVGLKYDIMQIPLRFYFDLRYFNTSASDDNLKNRADFNFGTEYDINKQFTLRGGVFTSADYRKEIEGAIYIVPIGEYTQTFITLGGTAKINKLGFTFAFMNSTILKTGEVEQTYLTGGISYGF